MDPLAYGTLAVWIGILAVTSNGMCLADPGLLR